MKGLAVISWQGHRGADFRPSRSPKGKAQATKLPLERCGVCEIGNNASLKKPTLGASTAFAEHVAVQVNRNENACFTFSSMRQLSFLGEGRLDFSIDPPAGKRVL